MPMFPSSGIPGASVRPLSPSSTSSYPPSWMPGASVRPLALPVGPRQPIPMTNGNGRMPTFNPNRGSRKIPVPGTKKLPVPARRGMGGPWQPRVRIKHNAAQAASIRAGKNWHAPMVRASANRNVLSGVAPYVKPRTPLSVGQWLKGLPKPAKLGAMAAAGIAVGVTASNRRSGPGTYRANGMYGYGR